MYLPNHYAAFFIFVLFMESGALFLYTLIGLLKQNPLPLIIPPEMPQPPACQSSPSTLQNNPQVPPAVNFGLIGPQNGEHGSVSYITVTNTVTDTVTTTAFTTSEAAPSSESSPTSTTDSTPISTSTSSSSAQKSTTVVFTTVTAAGPSQTPSTTTTVVWVTPGARSTPRLRLGTLSDNEGE